MKISRCNGMYKSTRAERPVCSRIYIKNKAARHAISAEKSRRRCPPNQVLVSSPCAHQAGYIIIYFIKRARTCTYSTPELKRGSHFFLGSLLLAATQCAQGNTPERFLFCFIIHIRTLQSIGDKKFPQATGPKVIKCTHYAGNFVRVFIIPLYFPPFP